MPRWVRWSMAVDVSWQGSMMFDVQVDGSAPGRALRAALDSYVARQETLRGRSEPAGRRMEKYGEVRKSEKNMKTS